MNGWSADPFGSDPGMAVVCVTNGGLFFFGTVLRGESWWGWVVDLIP